MSDTEDVRHDPEILSAGRRGSWANCTCGWRSQTYVTAGAAAIAFAAHLRDQSTGDHPS